MVRIISKFALIIMAMPTFAQERPAAATSCATCHGGNGIATISSYPNLAGQNAGYLKAALKAYRDGKRVGGTAGLMKPIAMGLSDEDIEALAEYYSSLPANGKD